jgi:hypothetical protein
MAWGDSPFFGGSVFETPPAPAQQQTPAQNPYGQYTYGPSHSGHLNSGGQTFTGYREVPYQGLVYVDCNRPLGSY